jgi:hypothetical protein
MADNASVSGGYAIIDGIAFNVEAFSFGFYQETDEAGRVTSGVKTHLIELSIEISEEDQYTMLFDWAFKADKQLDGTITFLFDAHTKYREIEFEQAYCIMIHNSYNSGQSTVHKKDVEHVSNNPAIKPWFRGDDIYKREIPNMLHLKITASKISVANIVHQNPW